MGRILIMYDSHTGCTEQMAHYVRDGAKKLPGHEVRMLSCDEAQPSDVLWADGLAVGTPTNLGGISWRMKKWWDDFSADHWNKVDGKLCCTFSSQGGHGGGAELASMAMATVLMNFGFLYFGVTDYVDKIHTLHYGAVVAKKPRNKYDQDACMRLGLRLAEWVAVFVDGRRDLHPLLTTKKADAVLEEAGKTPAISEVAKASDGKDSSRVSESGASSSDESEADPTATVGPVHVVVTKDVPKENQDKWLDMAEELSHHTWREDGCMSYSFVKSNDKANRFVIIEEWASMEALEKHFEAPHFKKLVPAMDAISDTVNLDVSRNALSKRNTPRRLAPSSIVPVQPQKRVLIFTKATDYIHTSLPAAASWFTSYCAERGWQAVVSEDSSLLEKPNSMQFDAIVLVNNSGEIFDPKQEVFTQHIEEGRGVMAVHAALACFLNGEDAVGGTPLDATCTVIEDTFGAHFRNHPPPQEGKVVVSQEAAHAFSNRLADIPETFTHTDEFFNYNRDPAQADDVVVLASVDEDTYKGGSGMKQHPVVWYRHLGKHRAPVFCCALGHFSHFYNGIGPGHVRKFLKAGMDFVVNHGATTESK